MISRLKSSRFAQNPRLMIIAAWLRTSPTRSPFVLMSGFIAIDSLPYSILSWPQMLAVVDIKNVPFPAIDSRVDQVFADIEIQRNYWVIS